MRLPTFEEAAAYNSVILYQGLGPGVYKAPPGMLLVIVGEFAVLAAGTTQNPNTFKRIPGSQTPTMLQTLLSAESKKTGLKIAYGRMHKPTHVLLVHTPPFQTTNGEYSTTSCCTIHESDYLCALTKAAELPLPRLP